MSRNRACRDGGVPSEGDTPWPGQYSGAVFRHVFSLNQPCRGVALLLDVWDEDPNEKVICSTLKGCAPLAQGRWAQVAQPRSKVSCTTFWQGGLDNGYGCLGGNDE